jgi:hypothetical protein
MMAPVTAQVVEPVLDYAAAERARLVNAARAALLSCGGAVTIEMLAEAARRSPEATRQWLRRHRRAGRLVTVTHDGTVLVPTFQLTEAFELDETVVEVVSRLVAHQMSPWAVWDWFATPNTWLDGRTPAEAVADDPARVSRAVAGLFQE